jgi:VanZ family protein
VKARLGAYVPALCWAGVVAYVGGMDDPLGPTVDLPIDKVAHFFLYGVLGSLAAWGWQRAGRWPAWWQLILAVWLLGAWDEWRQVRVPGRSAEIADWIADAVGALTAFAVTRAFVGTARERDGNESESLDLAP